MARPRALVDTSGFYALLVRNDAMHGQAVRWLHSFRDAGHYAFTSDYIVDETATLLVARGVPHLVQTFFHVLDESEALSMVYVDETRFKEAKDYFLKHLDQKYSFTDCTTIILMREFGVKTALTKDRHFFQAGFEAVLAEG